VDHDHHRMILVQLPFSPVASSL